MDKDEQAGKPAAKGWRAGETFLEKSGGRPADPAGATESDQGAGPGDTSLPASEQNSPLLEEETQGEPQSWPGSGSPGTLPPPG